MGDLKNSVHPEEEKDKNPIIVFFSNLLGAIKLPFPPKKENGAEIEPPAASPQAEKSIKIKPAEAVDEGLCYWGFFILRWAWTRWNERKGPKKPDDQPPPAHD
ncbi:hypothetical protein DH2020_021516 [Rehmannia glutinosa]|uniref:Uncharacterized protein n=1 Tax=Rehmannia glutinosa TaxID=99300 RepID=A0ABR0WAN8_REHGL